MREIKFRAWCKRNQQMIDVMTIDFQDGALYGFGKSNDGFLSSSGKWSDYEIMQFTGLLDKNGKPVYEGDVIEGSVNGWTGTAFGKVKFVEGAFRAEIKNHYCGNKIVWDDFFGAVKVIGNVYEHPGLLNQSEVKK